MPQRVRGGRPSSSMAGAVMTDDVERPGEVYSYGSMFNGDSMLATEQGSEPSWVEIFIELLTMAEDHTLRSKIGNILNP